jgi:hypothetical protein
VVTGLHTAAVALHLITKKAVQLLLDLQAGLEHLRSPTYA